MSDMWKAVLLCFLAGVGCGGSSGKPDAGAGGGGTAGVGPGAGGGGAGGGGVSGAAGGVGGTVGQDAGAGDARVRDWSQVDALLLAAAADAGAVSFGLTIWDQGDQRIYERMLGGFTPDTRVAVASASKMVSGTVIFDAIRRGELTLDSTTGQVLGWTGANAAVTLRQLTVLHVWAARGPSAARTTRWSRSPRASTPSATPPSSPTPGTRFDYGSTHLSVAARMAEVASGKTWAQLFADTLRTPLGLERRGRLLRAPQAAARGDESARGRRPARVDERLRRLPGAGVPPRQPRGITVGTPALFDEQAQRAVSGRR